VQSQNQRSSAVLTFFLPSRSTSWHRNLAKRGNPPIKWQVNGHDPEKDFIAQCLRNAFWVRDQIQSLIGVKPWKIGFAFICQAKR
jgi:hypothetical protein